ncbi:helix-turn-helix domain-containing protein [Mesorhizobium sp. AR02]|uniref:helix-turn-helix domain-containing protein n=1 Tax=Mesorhizobium sp. AR02 TaxID=2865837 RepID=UPI0021606DCF|nr:helix-turn-helix domain-containing protein [Mesorhizobium sp. AR02]
MSVCGTGASAHRLLKESTESIASIALRCGFVSASHLGSAYRNAFGRSPGEERRNVRPGTDSD